jgi:hypothetical protein
MNTTHLMMHSKIYGTLSRKSTTGKDSIQLWDTSHLNNSRWRQL